MLDKADQRHFAGTDVSSVVGSIQSTLHQNGILLQQTAPNVWTGSGTQSSWSIKPRVTVTVMQMPSGFGVDLRVSADFESNGIVLFVVAWVFFFPIAILLAVLGYQDWERRSVYLIQSVWAPLAAKMIAPPAPQWGPTAAAPGPPPAGYGGMQ